MDVEGDPERLVGGAEVTSPLADGRVAPRGVVGINPNLASRAGLQMGDRILAGTGGRSMGSAP